MSDDAVAVPTGTPEDPRNLNDALDMRVGEFDDERIVGSFEVSDRVRQPFGIVHGGAYASLAETLASVATFYAVHEDGNIAVGQNNDTSFLRPVSSGTVHAQGTRRHRGRTSWIWDFDFTDDDGRLCAISRVTIAVRAAPPARP